MLSFKIALVLVALAAGAFGAVWYYWTPKYTRTGYQPAQPIPFSHKIHAGQLQMDCRYCHSFVETAAHSNIPTAQVCMSCHSQVQKDSPKLEPLRKAWATGEPVQWVQIHKLPDYVYFNHSVHINRGVSCVSCHGRVDQMEEVYHAQSFAMKFCLDCHRAPENHLRPLDKITDLAWVAPQKGKETVQQAQINLGTELKQQRGVNPAVNNCAGCHR
ncbi:MAG: cytochrome c3 family protein [Chthoniobacteraceae bacterium]